MANAKIEAVHVATGIVKQMMSDERDYVFSDLQPGAYKVTILVSDSGATLQTDRAEVNKVIRSSQILDLLLINSHGRNFQVLCKVLPGFTPTVEAHSESGNSQRSMVTQATGGCSWAITPNWTERRSATRGCRDWWLMCRARPGSLSPIALKARHYFPCLNSRTGDPNRAPKNVQNQFGAMYGGRIIRNKLFFFGDWGRTTRRLAASALCRAPTSALRTGDFNGAGTTVCDPLTAATNGTGRSAFPNNIIPARASIRPRPTWRT